MMRQTKTKVSSLLMGVLFTGALVLFACNRAEDPDQHADHDHGEEVTETGHQADSDDGHQDSHDDHAMHSESETELSGTLQDGVRVVEMKARKFEFVPAKVVVNKGDQVRFKVTNEDVAHGIEIEGYDINQKLPPQETKTIEFSADKAGKYHFHCSVYCGSGHSDMHGELIVRPDE